MPVWVDSVVAAAIVSAAALIVGHFLTRKSQREEIETTRDAQSDAQRDKLVEQLGEQVDRLEQRQITTQARLEKVESRLETTQQALWDEQHHSHRIRGGLRVAVDSLMEVGRWLASDRSREHPELPDLKWLRSLLEDPRPRRPPPTSVDA